MSARMTIHFNENLLRLLKVKATQSGCSISELVNQATGEYFAEDFSDIGEWERRKSEPALTFEQTLKCLNLS
jgi:hypothetical protein